MSWALSAADSGARSWREGGVELVVDPAAQVVLGQPLVEEDRAQLVDQLVVDPLAQLVAARGPAASAWRAGRSAGRRRCWTARVRRLYSDTAHSCRLRWRSDRSGAPGRDAVRGRRTSATPLRGSLGRNRSASCSIDLVTADFGACEHDGLALVDRLRAPRRRSGSSASALTCRVRSTSLDVELHLGVRPVEDQLELLHRRVEQPQRLQADLHVLDVRDVHAGDEQHVVGDLDQAEHDVVEVGRACRRPRSAQNERSISTMRDHLRGADLVGEGRLERRRAAPAGPRARGSTSRLSQQRRRPAGRATRPRRRWCAAASA